MAERLGARGIALEWPLDTAPLPEADSKVVQSLRAMLREITNNIIKHAGGETVRVALASEGQDLVLTVEDDGVGFDAETVARGAGLSGLSERAARHGGSVAWSAARDGKGARVAVRLPCP